MKPTLCVMAVALGCVMLHAQVPEIYDVIPNAARAGEVIRIVGQDFDPRVGSNVVHIAGARARVLTSWVTELQVEVPPAVQPGPITVASGGAIAKSAVPFTPLFAPFGTGPQHYRTTGQLASSETLVSASAAADLDGDGDVELVLVQNGRLYMWEYVQREPLITAKAFRTVTLLTNVAANAIRSADLDADGKLDLLLRGGNGFRALRNMHDGGELTPDSFAEFFSTPTASGEALEIVDVDRDGRLDLLTLYSSTIWFVRNTTATSSNVFAPAVRISNPTRPATSLGIADLNRDGHVEVVTLWPPFVSIFSHNQRSGLPTTNAFVEVRLPATNVFSVEVGDIQGDGWTDLLLLNANTRRFEVYWNQSTGGVLQSNDFSPVLLSPQFVDQTAPRLLDLNGDSFPELLSRSSYYYENQSALLGDLIFAGTYLPSSNRFSFSFNNPRGLIMADLNADGEPDLIDTSFGLRAHQAISDLAPFITTAYLWENNFNFGFQGLSNAVVTVETSTNLTTWTKLRDFKLTTGNGSYSLGKSNETLRFYRVTRSPTNSGNGITYRPVNFFPSRP